MRLTIGFHGMTGFPYVTFWLDLNAIRFETNESADVILDVKSNTSANVVLQMSGATLSAGYDLYFVCLEFLQEVNGDYYDLENKRFNCLNVVEVI